MGRNILYAHDHNGQYFYILNVAPPQWTTYSLCFLHLTQSRTFSCLHIVVINTFKELCSWFAWGTLMFLKVSLMLDFSWTNSLSNTVRRKFLQPRMLKNLRRNRGLLKNKVSYTCHAIMVLIQYLVNLTFISHITALINLREELLLSGLTS